MLAYFSKAGYACTESQCNPSEHVLGLVRVDSASAETEAQSRARITALTDAYRASHESSAASDTGVADAGAKVSAHKSRLAQFGILLDRFLRNSLRSWHQLKWEFGPMILLSLLIGFVFYQLTTDQFGAHDRLGLVYVAVSFGAIRTILYTVERVENDRGQLYSELQDDLYGVMAFYWARFISRLPVDMLVTLVYAVPMYMISGLQEDATRFFSFLCFMFATLLLSRTLGEAISAWITDIQGALAAANVIFNVVFIPTGFFVHIYIPAWWLAWFAWISFLLRFPMEGILKFEYDGLTFTCPSGPCPITDETTAMEALYMQSANYWFAVGIILLLNFITIVLGLLGLYFVEQRPLADYADLDKRMRAGTLSLAIEIPPHFARNIKRGEPVQIGAWVDGAMPRRAETVQGYVLGMHQGWLLDMATHRLGLGKSAAPATIATRFRYNPDVKSLPAMVPAVIPMLLLMIPAMLTALSVVREKELGSIINLYVTPVTRSEFLLGKQLPYVVLAMLNFFLMTLLAVMVFDVPVKGSFLTLAAGALLFVIFSTGFGLFASTFTRSQIAAMFVTMIGTMILTRRLRCTYRGNLSRISPPDHQPRSF